ncbi:MAG: hypothetical protein OXH31_00805, partial [Gammaproteobacteria bacterium]|nr:hypothetical protein [Gammaproteobacteria bacterium]
QDICLKLHEQVICRCSTMTFSWWIDRFWEEDFSVNIELENEIYYRAEEESNDELLDQSTALSEVRGGGLGATPPGGRGIFQRRTVDTDTQSKGEKNDIWGIVEVRLYGDFDGDWDNDVIGGVGRILPKRIDTDRPEGFNLKWTINERGEEADSHNYRIKLLSSVRTKGMF